MKYSLGVHSRMASSKEVKKPCPNFRFTISFQTIYLHKNKKKNCKNIKQRPTRFVIDLNIGNIKVEIII